MLEIEKKLFLSIKTKFFKVPKNGILAKGFTHAIGQKMPIFSLFAFGQNKSRNKI